MPLAVGTQIAKDGGGTLIVGGLRAFDLSAAGDGSGPWTLGHVEIDGAGGANRAGVDTHGSRLVTLLDAAGAAVAPATQATLASILTSVDGLEGFTDGLETVIASTNTKLDTLAGLVDGLEGFTDGLETAIASTNTLLTTQAGYVDGLETAIAATNTLLTTQAGYVDGLETLLTTLGTDITNVTGTKAAGAAATSALLTGLVYNSSPITLSTGQQAALQGDVNGYLNVNVKSATGVGDNVAVGSLTGSPIEGFAETAASSLTSGNLGFLSLFPPTRGLRIAGDLAHDAVDAGPPLKIGGYAKAAAPTDVSADADRVNAWFLRNGAQATVLTAAGALIGGDATNGLDIDVTRMANLTESLIDDAAFTPATSRVVPIGFQADESSTDSIDEGDAGAARITLARKQIVTQQPHTKGGLLAFNSLDLDETEEDVKTSAGQVYGFNAANRTTSPLFLRFYNATAANTTVGTTATFLGPFEIPANASDHTVEISSFGGHGVEFDTAISAAVTTGFAANDTGAPAANACIVNVLYK